ncbi:hypothetical protein [Ruegeria atlantica]|uniref:hypothetical protein n=1 Tax=Ruegeria atlantica TaxID=81569 RepID=UPI0024948726|nr:hypothetical protein [Ruegeria atlantica]
MKRTHTKPVTYLALALAIVGCSAQASAEESVSLSTLLSRGYIYDGTAEGYVFMGEKSAPISYYSKVKTGYVSVYDVNAKTDKVILERQFEFNCQKGTYRMWVPALGVPPDTGNVFDFYSPGSFGRYWFDLMCE